MNNKKSVLDYFYEICAIPHGSGNTDAIADYCVKIAKSLGLWYKRDEFNNVIIKKPASKDKITSEPVIIQGHLDMVCAKTEGMDFDFEKDGIKCIRDGDFIKADNTTLGADNGIAVAYALALLSDESISAPPLEIVLTSDEETGMVGANKLDASVLDAKRLINIDSEEEGVFTVSCAGGARANLSFEFKKEKTNGTLAKMVISGITGGHSGTEIHKRGRNANKVIAEILNYVSEKLDIKIADINGGDKDNAIAVNADAKIVVDSENIADFEALVYECFDRIKAASPVDENMQLELCLCDNFEGMTIGADESKHIIKALYQVKNGVVAMDENNKGLVKTSLNLGALTTTEDSIKAAFALRSNDNSELDALIDDLSEYCARYNIKFSTQDRYPAWEYVKDSYLRDIMVKIYEKMYDNSPKITVIHAGLECGVFAGKLGRLDAVSIGPEMYDVHTVRERVSISSVMRVWEFLQEALRNL